MKVKTIRRGDLFYYDFGKNPGSIQCGERPVLVLQADEYIDNAPTVLVAAITSVIKKRQHKIFMGICLMMFKRVSPTIWINSGEEHKYVS